MTTKSEQMPDFALLARELERCGWRPDSSGPLEGDLLFQTSRGAVRAPTLLLHGEPRQPLLVVNFEDFELTDRQELFPRFLDFSLETRMALGAAHLIASAGRLLLTSARRIELYSLPDESLEYHASSPREFEDELLPALAAKARARGDSLGALPNAMESAQTLHGWLSHWSRQLAAPLQVSPADCTVFLWKLILMLQTKRKTERSELLGGWGLGCEKHGDSWTLSYDSINTHDDLARELESFDQTFSSRIFSGDAETHVGWLGKLEETSLMEQLRAELLMQSQGRFQAETVAWLQSDLEREQRGWRREVSGLPAVGKRFGTQGWNVIHPLTCDVGEFGLNAALRDADRLAEHWSQHDAYLQRRARDRDELPTSQPELFAHSPRGINPMNQLDDGINFVFGESLRLKGVRPEELLGVGIAFLLKALTWPNRWDWPFFGIDTLDRMWADEDGA